MPASIESAGLAARLRGSICALATPFREGRVDVDALIRLVEWHIENGTHGLVACGTTAETPALTTEEKALILAKIQETVAGRIPVILGTGGADTAAAIVATRAAEEAQADGVLIVTPYYNRPSQEGLLAHFEAVHRETGLPIVLYNVPGRTGVDMTAETVARLSALDRIIGIKDATGDMARASDTRRLCGPEFLQLSGEDGSALGFNAHGGHGCISVTANVAPRLCATMQSESLGGRMDGALAAQDKLAPLHGALFVEASPQPTKYGLSALGLCTDEMRLPLVSASPAARAAVDAAMAHAGLTAPR